MLYSATAGFIDTDGMQQVEAGGSTCYYSGTFWTRGCRAGRDSVTRFAEEAADSGTLPFDRTFGAFRCAVVRPDGATVFFTDNSHLNAFYHTDDAISDSLLELIRYVRPLDFDDAALCEYLTLGAVYFGRTVVRGISVTRSDAQYVISNGSMRIEPKGIDDVDAPARITDVAAFFEDMAHALSGERVTLSLTGGYDSRLVLACLMDNLPLDVFISASDPGDPDALWAARAAKAAGKDLEILMIDMPSISDGFVRQLFEDADGSGVVVDDNHIRIHAFMEDRRRLGYTCYLTGDGGVRHKDWYWMQDLPFYRRPHTDVGRFYDQRIQVIPHSIPFGPRLEAHAGQLRERMVSSMRRHVKPINTESYDAIGYHVQGDAVAVKYGILSRSVPSYAPLWELELVRYSYHLPRRRRFFYNSMRDIITERSRPLARVPTVYGTTASSERRYLCRDVLFQGLDYARKAARLAGRSVLHRNLFVGHATRWTAEGDVRALGIANEALAFGVSEGMIQPDTRLGSLSYSTLGRLIQLSLLAERMGPQAGPACPSEPFDRR